MTLGFNTHSEIYVAPTLRLAPPAAVGLAKAPKSFQKGGPHRAVKVQARRRARRHVLRPRSGGTTGAALGQGLGFA